LTTKWTKAEPILNVSATFRAGLHTSHQCHGPAPGRQPAL
jgi:hypothetical protein